MKPLRFFVWQNVLCRYGTPGLACASGDDEVHARVLLCNRLAQEIRDPGETVEEARNNWLHYFEARPATEITEPQAFYVEAEAG